MRSASRFDRARPSRRTLGLPALALLASGAHANGSLDLSIAAVEVTQSVQTGTTQLNAEKSTFVRAMVQATGTVPPGTLVDGVMRVFVDGEEASFSPVYSSNGPIVPQSSPSSTVLDDTLNFVFLPPEGSVSVSVEVNPEGPVQVPETDFGNNVTATAAQPFVCRRLPEIVYVPIDYRPNHEPVPNLPSPELIEPGVGDNFLQGIYPSGDWHYFAAPPKLWGQSLAFTGSVLNTALEVDLQQMVPQPDFIYGWVAGGLSYNGQALGIPGVAAMGNTQPIRHQRTFAHELGHLFGLFHVFASTGVVGIDVEHQLNETQALPQLKPASLRDIMEPGLLTNQAWIAPFNYDNFNAQPEFQCAPPTVVPPQPSLLVAGVWNRESGAFELTDTFVLNGRRKPTVAAEDADLLIRVLVEGEVVDELGIAVSTPTDSCAHGSEEQDSEHAVDPIAGFVSVLPTSVEPSAIDGLSVVDARTGRELAALQKSAAAPVVTITSPGDGDLVGGSLELAWQGSDADGDALRYYVRYSPDGSRVVPLASNVAETSLQVDAASLPALAAGGYFEVLATDGLNTSSARVAGLAPGGQLLAGGGNAPIVHVATPDTGTTFPQGATIVLHSSGWDEEDRALDGGSVVWSSDLDGIVGTSRLTMVQHLSVGTHVLTVTATDSSGLDASDTTTITITARTLPDGNEVTCQENLGFSGPGSSLLKVCGGDLSSGTTADVTLTGAAPNAAGWLLYSLTSNPIPAGGGTIVPVPPSLLGLTTDAAGEWSFEGTSGGGGPFTLYVQALYVDATEPFGVGLSNAVKVDYLP